MNEQERLAYVVAANVELAHATFLEGGICDILQMTRGSITWRQIAAQLENTTQQPAMVSFRTIRRHIMSTPSFSYVTNRFQPSLSWAQIQK